MKLKSDWNIKIGGGRSQIVGVGNHIYVTTGTGTNEGDTMILNQRTIAIDATNGTEEWSSTSSTTMRGDQETFSGSTASPQSTPVIAGEFLITISFSGKLACLNRLKGNIVWQKDLVKDVGAAPVQFGFSSSPVIDTTSPDRVLVLAAGKSTGFYCLNVADGAVIWKSECRSCSYATPVSANLGGIGQWIIVSEDEIMGIAKNDGRRLWRYELPASGLTNVPTPLVVNDSDLIISGQGCQGTRCLSISKTNDQWAVNERWHSRDLQFFYTNWLKWSDDIVIGCTDKYLAALDTRDGSLLGRWRGYGNGNVAIAGNRLLVVDGKGNLSVIEPIDTSATTTGFEASRKFAVLKARCWTPLSVIDQRIFIRGDDRLACLTVGQQAGSANLENLLPSSKPLNFQKELTRQSTADLVQSIFDTFEARGQAAALALYAKLRSERKLDEESRLAIAEAAVEQGLDEVAKMILVHAAEDFPESRLIQTATKNARDK